MYAPLALALLAACSSDDVLENNNETTTQGQTLTIRATTGGGGGTRVSFDEDSYATKWATTDKVYIYAGGTDKVGEFSVKSITNDHNAVLTGNISGTLSTTDKTDITGYIYNPNVNTSDNGSTAAVANYGKHIDVDYSEQKGTWEDAMSRCVLFGQGTYDPNNAGQPVDMKFEYKTTFFKLMLDFGDTSINTTATMCLTGDNMVSNSRINAIGENAGKTNYVKDLFINIKDVTITNGKATVYVAMYSQPLKNVYLQAVLKNGADGADGDVYDFNISNNSTKAIYLATGKVYPIERTGVKQETSSTWEGEGSESNPYLIKSVADLKLLANNVKNQITGAETGYNGKYFKLTSDLIINGEWEPIGNYQKNFRGSFDGDGHTISGDIKISNVIKNYAAGLFGIIGVNSVVKNINSKLNVTAKIALDGDKDAGTTYVGSLIGCATSVSIIENCINKGSVIGNAQFVGGLLGGIIHSKNSGNNLVSIEACGNEGSIVTNTSNLALSNIGCGGLIGGINGKNGVLLQVKGCYATGAKLTMTQDNKMVAGIIGIVFNSTTDANQVKITSCLTRNITLNCTTQYKASLVASANANNLVYTVSKCWTDDKANKFVAPNKADNTKFNPTPTLTECYNASSKTLDKFVLDMNDEWNSATYEFNSKGEIVKKTK